MEFVKSLRAMGHGLAAESPRTAVQARQQRQLLGVGVVDEHGVLLQGLMAHQLLQRVRIAVVEQIQASAEGELLAEVLEPPYGGKLWTRM